MGKAKWWVCDSCISLNDVPANKCYKCREPKPSDPKLIDDQYAEVGGPKRVGITVDLDQVGDLTRPDPVETSAGGAVMEAFEKVDDPYADIEAQRPPGTPQAPGTAQPPPTQQPSAQPSSTPRYDPYAGTFEGPQPPAARPTPPAPKPMREPTKRGIEALGARMWAERSDVYAGSPPPPATPPGPGEPAPPPPPGAPRPPAAPRPSAAPRPPGPPPETPRSE